MQLPAQANRVPHLLPVTPKSAGVVQAQPLSYTISIVAGGSAAFDFAEGKAATSFLIQSFYQPAIDKQGNFYFSLGIG